MLEQETDVVLRHGLGDERLKHQAVHTLLFQTWSPRGEQQGQDLTSIQALKEQKIICSPRRPTQV